MCSSCSIWFDEIKAPNCCWLRLFLCISKSFFNSLSSPSRTWFEDIKASNFYWLWLFLYSAKLFFNSASSAWRLLLAETKSCLVFIPTIIMIVRVKVMRRKGKHVIILFGFSACRGRRREVWFKLKYSSLLFVSLLSAFVFNYFV